MRLVELDDRIAVVECFTIASHSGKQAIAVIRMPDVQEKFRAASVEPVGNSPAETSAFIAQEAQRWGEVIRKNNIVVD